MQRYDTIVIGAGHNGLVCATYLARKGQRVLLLEAADNPGGLASLREYHPGFKVSIAHSAGHFARKIVDDLQLEKHGLRTGVNLSTVGLAADGNHVRIQDGAIYGVGAEDTTRYQDYVARMRRFADALAPFWLKTIPRVAKGSVRDAMTFAHMGLNIRSLGQTDMRELLRIATLPPRDLMDEQFDSELLKAVLSWDGLVGAKLAPRSPNNSVLPMLYRLSEAAGHSIPADGLSGLVAALSNAAVAQGVEIRTGAPVERVLVDADAGGLAAVGVRLVGGEELHADRVVSSADPQRTLLQLVGVEHLEIQFTDRIHRLRCAGLVGKLHLALRELPDFTGLEHPDGRLLIAPDMDAIEFAFDASKYGECSQQPVMEVVIPSLHDATLAPAGQHVLSAHVMYIPHELKGGWNDAARAAIRDRAIDTLAAYAPGIRDAIVHAELLTPFDLEQQYRVTGGHWHHTELAIDQMLMMRPTYEAAQYSTPVPGLYLCGAGCHPGGDITGMPGHNAAAEILK